MPRGSSPAGPTSLFWDEFRAKMPIYALLHPKKPLKLTV